MIIGDIENEIIGKIREKIPELHVEGFPDQPSEFRLTHPKGAILVYYLGANYSQSKNLGYIVQDKTLEFSITIITRDLRSCWGVYHYIDFIRNLLTGYKPENCSKMQPVKEHFISENTGIWQYEINFTLTTPNIEGRRDMLLI